MSLLRADAQTQNPQPVSPEKVDDFQADDLSKSLEMNINKHTIEMKLEHETSPPSAPNTFMEGPSNNASPESFNLNGQVGCIQADYVQQAPTSGPNSDPASLSSRHSPKKKFVAEKAKSRARKRDLELQKLQVTVDYVYDYFEKEL